MTILVLGRSARRRREASERRRSAQQQETARNNNLEHLYEISRRSAKLNAAARLLAKHRNKAVALAAAVNAAAESTQNRRGVADKLLSDNYVVGASTHGSREGASRAMARSTCAGTRLGRQSPSSLPQNPPGVREWRKSRRKRRKSRRQRQQPLAFSSKQRSSDGNGNGREIAHATPLAYPVGRIDATASNDSLHPIGMDRVAQFSPQVECDAAERQGRVSFQSREDGWQGGRRTSGVAGWEWGAGEAAAMSGGLRKMGGDRTKGMASIAVGESRFRRRRNEDRTRAAPEREGGCAPYQVPGVPVLRYPLFPAAASIVQLCIPSLYLGQHEATFRVFVS